MKSFKWSLVSLIVLVMAIFTLVGCGIPQADYDALLAQKTALEAEKRTAQTNFSSLQTEKKALESEKTALESEKQTLQNNYDRLNDDHNALQAEQNALKAEKEQLQNQYEATNTELANIKTLYPPRDFDSKTELENWLAQNTVSAKPDTDNAEDWIGRALEIQEDALLDGYIVNVDYDYTSTDDSYFVFCTTVIDGFIWFWDPETDDISQDTTLTAVK